MRIFDQLVNDERKCKQMVRVLNNLRLKVETTGFKDYFVITPIREEEDEG